MKSGILRSGLRAVDTASVQAAYNRVAMALADANASPATLIGRMRVVAGMLTESADAMAGIASEEIAHMDCERFWRSRANGARGEDA